MIEAGNMAALAGAISEILRSHEMGAAQHMKLWDFEAMFVGSLGARGRGMTAKYFVCGSDGSRRAYRSALLHSNVSVVMLPS